MLYEFALDPSILRSFDKVRYYIENFGVYRARLISRFPRKWKRMVYEACASCGDIEKTKIEVSLINADAKFINSNRSYDRNLLWLDNAEKQNAVKPFHAIISSSNPRNIISVLIDDELTERNALWNVPREKVVPRTAADLTRSVQQLLQISSEILFIDPYFDPYAPRYRKPLMHFASAMSSNNRIRRIEYHLKYELDCDAFQTGCRENMPQVLPVGFAIKFIRWRQIEGGETLHPRYVLTDKGGVRIEHGLDEGLDGEFTDISLLDWPLYQQRWRDYCESPAFEFVDDITIVGTRNS
jgi:hypothetical protein